MKSLIALFLLSSTVIAAEPTRQEWTVDGVKREALVALPKTPKDAPIVFVWHGHGGTMRNAARGLAIHPHWPEALCIYPQGLNTPGPLTDPEGKKTGWQHNKGDQGDRDLKLFDVMKAWAVKEHGADPKKVFSTGHSNGGGFSYLLWATRGEHLAAIAPSAAAGARLKNDFKPLPVFHLGAENDPLVKFTTMQKPAIEAAKKVNGVSGEGKTWNGVSKATIFESKTGTPVVTYIHDGEHKFPQDGSKHIAAFFKEIVEAQKKSN